MCAALCSPAERDAFKRDEEAFMARFSLTEEEKNLIRKRDFKGLIEAGMNIYAHAEDRLGHRQQPLPHGRADARREL